MFQVKILPILFKSFLVFITYLIIVNYYEINFEPSPKFHQLNSITLPNGLELNFLGLVEKDGHGENFIWLSDGTEIITFELNNIKKSDAKVRLNMFPTPCGYSTNFVVLDGNQAYELNEEGLELKIDFSDRQLSQVLILPILKKDDIICTTKNGDSRKFFAKMTIKSY